MISWIHQEITHEDKDQEVWGDYWSRYTLEDLKEFVELGGKLRKTRTNSRPCSSDEEDHLTSKGKGRSHKKKYNN
jgi:hypothetical protein